MSKDWGIKISQPGFDVLNCDEKNLAFSSKYQTLHIHSQGSGTVTDSGGRTVTITHNLGYVPKFLVHTQLDSASSYGDANSYFISPYNTGSGGISGNLGVRDVNAWADTTKLYIKFGDGFGYKEYHTGREGNNYGTFLNGVGYINNSTGFGKYNGNSEDGAIRFLNVALAQGTDIYKAELMFYIGGTTGSGDKPVNVYGIDEDNTADFGGDPFGRPKTTAVKNETVSSSITSGYWGTNVTDLVQEILDRGGWSSGYPMGFLILNNGASGTDNDLYDSVTGIGSISYSYLRILLSNTLGSYKYTIFLDKIE